jgi:putative hydrolase of the HAD superfamily
MTAPDVRTTVFVFDLDDTLYMEADYVASGRAHVCEQVRRVFGHDLHPQVEQAVANGEQDWLGYLIRHADLPSSTRESLLWAYRLHTPAITLSPDWLRLLQRLESEGRAILVLTDGRSMTQRLKLKALGLGHLPALISDDWGGGDKRDPLRFHEVMRLHPEGGWLYVGDNPQKDFIVPRELGWRTVGLRTGERGIHSQVQPQLGPEHQPDVWLDDANQLERWLGLGR